LDFFWPLTLVQPHTRAAAVLVDELDTSQFKAKFLELSESRWRY